MNEQFCDVGRGITLCYETFGNPEDPPVLLVMGLATQMIGWHEDFCRQLAERGYYVVRFDNRDAGRSTHMDFRAPGVRALVRRRFEADQYDLGDMAEDALGLMRELDLVPAHVIGISMGGMIAQTIAARHPEAVRSLVSLHSTTGGRRVGQPHWRVYRNFVKPRPRDPEAVVEQAVAIFKVIGSPPPNRDLEMIRERAIESLKRDQDPFAGGRQLAALLHSGDRTRELARIEAPTLVIHGDKDRMINPSGGRATAEAIPGARLVTIEGQGHDLARVWWPQLFEEIGEHLAEAGRPRSEPRSEDDDVSFTIAIS